MPEAQGIYWEERGTGSPLLLSSGLGGSAAYWAPNVAALAARHRVLSYDHRGTGRSERKVEGMLTVERMAEDMLAVLDAAGVERATVIGHAAGGLAALALALRAPDRVDRLVVVNGWARLDPQTARCFDTRLTLLRDSGPRAYFRAQPLFLYPPRWNSEHHQQLLDEEEEQLAHFAGVEMTQRRIAAVRLFNIAERLHEIPHATLCLASDDDILVPCACSARLAEGLPGGQLTRLAEGGHACNVTRAEHFNSWLTAWLDNA